MKENNTAGGYYTTY